jgi:hypothetical protein
MKLFSMCFFIALFVSGPSLLAQDQDTPEVDQAAQEVEQTITEVEDYLERKAEFGVRAGLNFSTFNDAETLNPDSQTGLHLGLYGRYLWSERLSGKAEVMYSSLGARADEFYIFDDYSIHLNYLQLIVTGEFEVANGFRLELGPYLGVLLGAQQSFGGLDTTREGIEADADETNFVDVGFVAGGTYTFDSGFNLGLRYQQGFADALGSNFFQSASGSNSVVQVSIGQTF